MTGSHESRKVRKYLDATESLLLYPGEPNVSVPHFVLSGKPEKHSNGYVNVGLMLKEFPEIRVAIANDIVRTLRQMWNEKVDRVVGAANSSTDLAKDVARAVNAQHISMVKVDEQGRKLPRQIWNYDKNTPLRDGEVILQVEDLITTSSSSLQIREGIRDANPGVEIVFAPILPVVVDRSDLKVLKVEESVIMPLLWLSIQNYDPETCPYCAVGSPVVFDVKKNWVKLVSTSTPSVELGGVKWR